MATAALKLPIVATLHDLWLLCANNMLLRQDGSLCRPDQASCGNCFREYDYWAPIPKRRRTFQYLTRHVRQFLSPSQRLIELHVEGGYAVERFTLLRHGLKPLARAPVGVPPAVGRWHSEGETMAFVGAVVVSKGVGILLEALPALIDEIPGFRLIVAGRGPEALENRLRRFGDHVVMLGHVPRSHIAEVYAGAGITLMASTINENSPLTVCESLLAGTPVLGARIGGIPELIVEQETGYLYESTSPQQLVAGALRHFGRPSKERRDMRRACCAYAEREFSLTSHVEKLVGVYRSAIAAGEPSTT